jgi:2-polyprenyl-3-methyl-5-hydroxy-6-metoxy-1,4-benzoquinol methylase
MGFLTGTLANAILNRYRWAKPGSAITTVYDGKSKLEMLFGPSVWEEFAAKTVIDFGCEFGKECREIQAHGAKRVIGLDIRPHILEIARQHSSEIEYAETTTEKADVILSLDSFDHYPDPAGVLRTMHELLARNGHVIVSFGPTWKHPLGGHGFSVFPWAHLLFSEAALIRWFNECHTKPLTRFSDIDEGLNGMTIKKFIRFVESSPLKFKTLTIKPIRKARWLHNWFTREYLTSVIQCRLEHR